LDGVLVVAHSDKQDTTLTGQKSYLEVGRRPDQRPPGAVPRAAAGAPARKDARHILDGTCPPAIAPLRRLAQQEGFVLAAAAVLRCVRRADVSAV
jgi:hypothetical protein